MKLKTLPSCYSILHDMSHEACQSCLINVDCSTATNSAVPLPPPENVSRNEAILQICIEIGADTTWRKKASNEEFEIRPDNIGDFGNLNFLLTQEVLQQLYSIVLERKRNGVCTDNGV